MRSRVAVLIAAVPLLAAGNAGATTVLPSLYVTYGPNCIFTLVGDGGASVTTIAAGVYQVVFTLTDDTTCTGLPDFHLTGPGVNLETPVDSGTGGTAQYTETFQPGSTYVAVDSHQPVLSKITFTTFLSSGPPPTPTLPTSSSTSGKTNSQTDIVGSALKSNVFRGTIDGTLSAAGKLTFTFKGKAVKHLVVGKYTVSVVDKSRTSGFVVQELHGKAATVTGGSFVGTRSVVIALTAGQAYFYSTAGGKKSPFTVVPSI